MYNNNTNNDILNKEFFVKKKLLQESRNHIPNELIESVEDCELLYVIEWHEYAFNNAISGRKQESAILACGIGLRDGLAKYKRVNCQPGLYVFTSCVLALKYVAAISNYNVEVFEQFDSFELNNFTIFELLYSEEPKQFHKKAILCKIVTPTVDDAEKLHKLLRNQYVDTMKEYAAIPFYWNIDRLVMFELFVRNTDPANFEKTIYSRNMKIWIDENMKIYNEHSKCKLVNEGASFFKTLAHKEINIPIITFDIETSSTENLRLPTGEHETDELVSVAIYHKHTDTMYSLAIYLSTHRHLPKNCIHAIRINNIKLYRNFISTNVLYCNDVWSC